jgi:pyruvate-ferredoxin/flavodoxin oxidoreductase
MDRFAEVAGRSYKLFDYVGDPEAERVVVIMGSGAEAVHEMVEWLNAAARRSASSRSGSTARSQRARS